MIFTLPGSRTVRAFTAAVVGGAAGAGVYGLQSAGGVYAFTAVGAAVGALGYLAAGFYRRTARLTEMRITVPQLSELTFVVNDHTRAVSWQLFVESVTRTSTQRLDDGDGNLREVLTSLYGLFATTRDILKAARPTGHGDGVTVEYLAVNLLNRELRPFLSKWHVRLREFEDANPGLDESRWPQAAECRRELARLQDDVQKYVLDFARLAGVRDPELMLGTVPRTP
ncbi:hypothetical protein [Streptomyces lucensis]|uniref:hypothetical protein n=1 Tax=Streptomyces lucensis TaxID=67319 RepID=UPI0016796567|nr:hypothetical protein [Streptomyces lucensis]